jgi:hypothetical protein
MWTVNGMMRADLHAAKLALTSSQEHTQSAMRETVRVLNATHGTMPDANDQCAKDLTHRVRAAEFLSDSIRHCLITIALPAADLALEQIHTNPESVITRDPETSGARRSDQIADLQREMTWLKALAREIAGTRGILTFPQTGEALIIMDVLNLQLCTGQPGEMAHDAIKSAGFALDQYEREIEEIVRPGLNRMYRLTTGRKRMNLREMDLEQYDCVLSPVSQCARKHPQEWEVIIQVLDEQERHHPNVVALCVGAAGDATRGLIGGLESKMDMINETLRTADALWERNADDRKRQWFF